MNNCSLPSNVPGRQSLFTPRTSRRHLHVLRVVLMLHPCQRALQYCQARFSVETDTDLVDHTDNSMHLTNGASRLKLLSATVVKVDKTNLGVEEFTWQRGGKPVFNDQGTIREGEPTIVDGVNSSTVLVTKCEPNFQASEYCRILHVLADARMTRARTQLMEPRTRAELDTEAVNPWTDHIDLQFNDESFTPVPSTILCDGVTRSDISSLKPNLRPYERDGGVLKRKLAELKSLYGTS
eukprot:GFKZ01005218.1.p1 GENE.GFKZ01005218.1~~GFKZ01005218.1.p1  ORF type:complete len:238 (-),score=14.12 GFKZ01005218.1:831-1544(-)